MDKRHDNFRRLAAARTNEAIRRIRILGNCANRSHYDYTDEEVSRIFSEIDKRLKEIKAKFTFPAKEREFKL